MKCEMCNGTGYYGDNGPGIRGNSEYQPCDNCRQQPTYDAAMVERVLGELISPDGFAPVLHVNIRRHWSKEKIDRFISRLVGGEYKKGGN